MKAGRLSRGVHHRLFDGQGLQQDKEIAKALEHLLPSGLPIRPAFSTTYNG